MMNPSTRSRSGPTLTPEQESLIERFLAAYNAVDHELRRRMRLKESTPFSDVVRAFSDAHSSWRADEQRLLAFGRLRNFVVHNLTEPYQRLAVPVIEAVEALESIRERLAQRVIPAYQRPVVTVELADTLAFVLRLISKHDFSQFPVMDTTGKYRGLLTENGITRWLAHHTTDQMTLVEFEDVTVEEVLREEEQRPNAQFVSRHEPLDAILSAFAQRPHLEAILITETGRKAEKLLGFATRWDLPGAP